MLTGLVLAALMSPQLPNQPPRCTHVSIVNPDGRPLDRVNTDPQGNCSVALNCPAGPQTFYVDMGGVGRSAVKVDKQASCVAGQSVRQP